MVKRLPQKTAPQAAPSFVVEYRCMSKKILVLPGSVRTNALCSKVTGAFETLAPEGIDLQVADIGSFPLFNQDLELPEPEFLVNFKNDIRSADAILIITPEYNRSYPAVVKNALDWGSRPPATIENRVWNYKPTAIAGYSPYSLGGVGAVLHLRQVLTSLNMPALQQPEFYLSQAADKFDEAGNLIDEGTENFIKTFWIAFNKFIEEVNSKK